MADSSSPLESIGFVATETFSPKGRWGDLFSLLTAGRVGVPAKELLSVPLDTSGTICDDLDKGDKARVDQESVKLQQNVTDRCRLFGRSDVLFNCPLGNIEIAMTRSGVSQTLPRF